MSLTHKMGPIASAVRHYDGYFGTNDVIFQQQWPEYLKDKSKLAQKLFPMAYISRSKESKFGKGSIQYDRNLVNGAGYSLENNTNMAAVMAGFDFTIECWIKSTSIPGSTQGNILGQYFSTNQRAFKLYYDKTNKRMTGVVSTTGSADITAYFRCGATNDGVSEATLFDGNWHFVSMTRSSNSLYIHVDGSVGNTVGIISGSLFSSSAYFVVGTVANSATARRTISSVWEGLIDEVRITKNNARYGAGNYTIPIKRFPSNSSDPLWDDVVLLLHGDGAFSIQWDGAYPQTKIPNGGNELDTPFTDTSGLVKFSGQVGPYFPYDISINFQGSDFTFELFGLKFRTAGSGSAHIFGCWNTSSGFCWRIAATTTTLAFQYSFDGTTVNSQTFITGLTSSTDYLTSRNLAVVRSGSNLYLYLDGTRVVSTTIGSNLFDISSLAVRLSYYANANNSETVATTTRVKAVRLTKQARFTGGSYVVPRLPLPLPPP